MHFVKSLGVVSCVSLGNAGHQRKPVLSAIRWMPLLGLRGLNLWDIVGNDANALVLAQNQEFFVILD